MIRTNKYFSQIRIIILLFTACVIFLYKDIPQSVNNTVNYIYYSFITATPDSNIIIININQDDIEKAGGLYDDKTYFSFLIEKLKDLNCRKVGIETFLPATNNNDSTDELLADKIFNAGNVVISSVFSAYSSREQSAELLFPEPKILIPEIQTGHINYYGREGIHIPLIFRSSISKEPAFSLTLSDHNNNIKELPSIIKINFFCEWNKFNSYSLTEFAELIKSGSPQLQKLKDKIIIIGVSSNKVKHSASTQFDTNIPGTAIHAFAVDNILQMRFLRTEYERFSSFCFILLILILIISHHHKKILLTYLLTFIILLITGLLLFRIYYVELNYSMFIIPLILLFLFEIITHLVKKRSTLTLSDDGPK